LSLPTKKTKEREKKKNTNTSHHRLTRLGKRQSPPYLPGENKSFITLMIKRNLASTDKNSRKKNKTP